MIIAHRNPKGRRFYTCDQYEHFMGVRREKREGKKVVLYARASNQGRKDDLSNQVDFLRTFVNAKIVIPDEVIKDVGSGLNYKRKKWNILLDEVMAGEIHHTRVLLQDSWPSEVQKQDKGR